MLPTEQIVLNSGFPDFPGVLKPSSETSITIRGPTKLGCIKVQIPARSAVLLWVSWRLLSTTVCPTLQNSWSCTSHLVWEFLCFFSGTCSCNTTAFHRIQACNMHLTKYFAQHRSLTPSHGMANLVLFQVQVLS